MRIGLPAAPILLGLAVLGVLLVVVGVLLHTEEPSCPEGQVYERGHVVMLYVGKTMVPTYPYAGCVEVAR